MTQHLTIIGHPIFCDRVDCGEPAAVYLREQDKTDPDKCVGVAYCELCWLAARRAFSPLTAHDSTQAQAEAEKLVRQKAE